MSGTFSFPLSTKIDTKHAIAQNKIMVIDGQTVITGSFNFTTAAEEHNAENLLVIRDKDLAAKYAANWKVHADHSDPYAGRTEGYSQSHRTAGRQPVFDGRSGLRRLCRLHELERLPPAGLQFSREDLRKEPRAVCHAGRTGSGGKETLRGVQAVGLPKPNCAELLPELRGSEPVVLILEDPTKRFV